MANGEQALPCSSSQESLLSEVLEDKPKPLESKQRVGPNDFELLRVVGQGAFGKVRASVIHSALCKRKACSSAAVLCNQLDIQCTA